MTHLLPGLVLDTNTVLALWMFRDPRLAQLRTYIDQGNCVIYGREDTLEELRQVLDYGQFGLDAVARQTLWLRYRQRLTLTGATSQALEQSLPRCRDPDDQKFLEIARESGATKLLTRDRALLKLARHRLIRPCFDILTPEDFLTQLTHH